MSLSTQTITNGASKKGKVSRYQGKPIIETLTNGYCIVDQKWTVKYWNEAATKLLKVDNKDIVGKNLWDYFASYLPVEFYAAYYKVFLTDVPVHFQEYWSEMGSWFDVTTWFLNNELCISFKSSNQPYSESASNTEERLKTLTELYRYVTEITNDCLWEWNLKEKEIFWIDGGHKRVFGYPIQNKLVPESFWQNCIHPADRDRVLSKLALAIHDKEEAIWEDEYRFRKQDGDFLYVCDRGHILFDEKNKATRIIGATQDINDRVLMEKEMRIRAVNESRDLTNAALAAQENERISIGKELHDNLGQKLAVAKMYLQIGKSNLTKRKSSLNKSLMLVTEVINDIRKISKTLVIPDSDFIGVFDNIEILIKDLVAVQPIKIEFQKAGIDQKEIPDDLQVAIFRIVQEQLNNILKHSKATAAKIKIQKKANVMLLTISDNGKGAKLQKASTGVGIINIKSRVAFFHGKTVIQSSRGKGYQLKITIPFISTNDPRQDVSNL